MKRFKKLLAVVLATTMVMGMAVTASADDGTAKPDEKTGAYSAVTAVSVSTNSPQIEVTVPTEASFMLNPYKLEVGGKTDQVISGVSTITSNSNVDLKVGVNAQATIAKTSGLKLLAAEPAKTSGDKWAVISVVLSATNNLSTAPDANKIALTTKATDLATPYELDKDGTVYVGFTGKVNKDSTGAWSDADDCTVTLKYTFTPDIDG